MADGQQILGADTQGAGAKCRFDSKKGGGGAVVGGAAQLYRYALDEEKSWRQDMLMLEISRFLGIVIGIFPRGHPPAHFHAVQGGRQITLDIQSGVVHGDFPKRALRLVLEWLDLHKDELIEDWSLIQAGRPARKIAGLE